MSIQITGSGFYLPPYIENSKTTAQIIRKNEDWIISKTGVKKEEFQKSTLIRWVQSLPKKL